ncbi:MAG: hypothetical protein ACHQUC_01975 [Chlamydiales bacterium]
MSNEGVVFTGSSGNWIVDLCDHYLHLGRREDVIYRQVKESKLIIGEDTKENWLLSILRISSWITVVLPLLAGALRYGLKPSEDKSLRVWDSVMNDLHMQGDLQRARLWQRDFDNCMKVSGICRIAYQHIYPAAVLKDKPQRFFDEPGYGPYASCEKGVDCIGVIIEGPDEESLGKADVHEQSEMSKRLDMPICILSPRDSASANSMGEFSRAFKQVLIQRL